MSCQGYKHVSASETVLAVALAIGIVGSYVPQIYSIARNRTTEGISPYFLFLMNASACTMLGNMIILSSNLFNCCHTDLTLFQCSNSLLGLLQIFSAFLGPLLVLVLARAYTDPALPEMASLKRTVNAVLAVNAVTLVLVVTFGVSKDYAHHTATFLGVVGGILGVVQYFPQLATTYSLKHAGSLSIMMLLIQMPGGYLWCVSLAAREGSSWTTWLPVFIAASFQLVLLSLASYYSFTGTNRVVETISKPVVPPNSASQPLASQADQESEV